MTQTFSTYTAAEAYEEDCRRCPNYHDGTPRKPWDELDAVAQISWQRCPVPRNYAPTNDER